MILGTFRALSSYLVNRSTMLWMCTKTQKQGEISKRQAIFHKRPSRRACPSINRRLGYTGNEVLVLERDIHPDPIFQISVPGSGRAGTVYLAGRKQNYISDLISGIHFHFLSKKDKSRISCIPTNLRQIWKLRAYFARCQRADDSTKFEYWMTAHMAAGTSPRQATGLQ